jgi:hypothetical protein
MYIANTTKPTLNLNAVPFIEDLLKDKFPLFPLCQFVPEPYHAQ